MVGLFFGSFNPIHLGHTALATYLFEHTPMCEIWFVVSPQNPLKQDADLMNDHFRLDLVNLAIQDIPHFKSCDVEFKMPKPNYTIQTLERLHQMYPEKEFALIIGADNLALFDSWAGSERILANYPLYVYPREGVELDSLRSQYPQVNIVEAPLFQISSTAIRELVEQKKDVSTWLHPLVYDKLLSIQR